MSPKTYNGSCHCGQIKYTVIMDEALAPEGKGEITKCNCSICHNNGLLNIYPKREDVIFLDNSDRKLKEYWFGQKLKPHKFCPECGSSIMIHFQDVDEEPMKAFVAMNVSILVGELWCGGRAC